MTEQHWINNSCLDMSELQARAWLARVVPTPIGWLTEPARFPASGWRSVPSAFIFLDDERPSSRAFYKRMAARLASPRTTHCPGAHEAMLSQPVAVAEAMLRVATAAG